MDWLPSGIRTVALAADTLELNTLDASGTPTTAWRKMASFAAGDGKVAYSADGKTIATVVQDFTHAPAVYAGSAAAPRQITHDNDDLAPAMGARRSEEHTSELQSLMRSSYAVFCLNKKNFTYP